LLNFAIAVLAAYGLDSLLANARDLWVRRLRLVLFAIGGIILGAAFFFALRSQPINEGVLLAGGVALCLAMVSLARESGSIGRRTAFAIVTALALVELYNVGTPSFSNRYDKDRNKFVNVLLDNRDIVAFLRNEEARAEQAGGSPIR